MRGSPGGSRLSSEQGRGDAYSKGRASPGTLQLPSASRQLYRASVCPPGSRSHCVREAEQREGLARAARGKQRAAAVLKELWALSCCSRSSLFIQCKKKPAAGRREILARCPGWLQARRAPAFPDHSPKGHVWAGEGKKQGPWLWEKEEAGAGRGL